MFVQNTLSNHLLFLYLGIVYLIELPNAVAASGLPTLATTITKMYAVPPYKFEMSIKIAN